MKHKQFRAGLIASAGLVFSGLLAATPANAQSDAALFDQDAAIVADKAALKAATRGDARSSVAAALSARGRDKATTDSLRLQAEFAGTNGNRHARFDQTIDGKRVYGASVKVAFDTKGDLVHLIERVAPAGARIGRPTITDADALRAAIDRQFGATVAAPALASKAGAVATFGKSGFFYRAPTVERVIIARGKAGLEEGFLVETWSAKDNQLHHTVVDAIGRVAFTELRTNTDSYRVYPNSPGVSGTSDVNGPGSTTASPNGWLNAGNHQSIRIQGNNTDTYLDRDDSETPDAGGTTISDGNFLAVSNLAADPTIAVNQDAAVQNLFYVTNSIHDILYNAGFNEAAGNFQTNNFGRGGAANDPVNAEAQDGQGVNNANFATPGDGSRPRMQMYIWDRSAPRRDGDFDSDIIYHEYGHGLTWRMIGSMGSSVSGAIGEGMGDTLAFVINDDPALAEYSYNRAMGLRSVSADLQNETIANFASNRGVHRNGEIFGATMWDAWTNYKNAGHNSTTALADWVGGMNFIPANPTFIQMRDGFLQNTPAARQCLIWRAFAEHGMGVGAKQSSRTGKGTNSFTLPANCQP